MLSQIIGIANISQKQWHFHCTSLVVLALQVRVPIYWTATSATCAQRNHHHTTHALRRPRLWWWCENWICRMKTLKVYCDARWAHAKRMNITITYYKSNTPNKICTPRARHVLWYYSAFAFTALAWRFAVAQTSILWYSSARRYRTRRSGIELYAGRLCCVTSVCDENCAEFDANRAVGSRG